MPVAKLNTGGTPDAKKIADQVNISLDTFIRQAMGKESLPRTGEGPVQWMQWLHSMDQPDITGWSLSNPSNLKMQKCEKCSREFCSPINHRRHIRLHRRSSNSDKESQKYRDFLGAFWDKLSVDEVKEVVSLQDISLKETSGSALVQALATALGKPAIWSLPRVYIKAGSKLLEVIQAKPSRLPVTSEELFSILDDASERTFLCAGTAESVEKYVFDGEADKIGFDSKNLVACTSFLFEQKLVKACADEKNAEALRCQRLLFEEEEAAKKKHAEQLERKKVKKLRQKEQKAREQLNEEKGNLEVPADCFEVPLAEIHSVPRSSDSNSDSPDVSLDVSTCLKLVQFSSNEDRSIESQCDFSHQHLDLVEVQNVEPQPVFANSQRLSANAEWKPVLLERKKVKKLRKKEQKAREQSNEEKGNLEVPADCFEVPLEAVHSVPGLSDSNYDIPDASLNVSTCVKLVQFSSNEDMSVESQCDLSHQHLDSVKVHDGEPRPVSANSRRLSANAEWQAPKSQRFCRNGSNQNHQEKVEPLQKHKDSVSPVNSRKIWTRKVTVESDDASILEVQKEAIDQKQRNSEVMIGSLSISVKDWSTGRQGNCPVEAGAGSTQPAMPKKCNIVQKPAKHNAFQIGSNRVAAKLYMPVRHEVGRQDPEEGVISLKFDDRTSLHENPLQSCPMDSSGTHKNCQVPNGNAHQGWRFSISVAKAFLAQRWKEAITGDHVMLVRCPDTEFSERPEVPSSSSEIAPTLDSGEDSVVSSVDDLLPKDGVVQSSSSRKNKVKLRPETEKGIKIKYILKPKTHHLGSER
ncbi:uncharacterized protein LOC125874604 isoform X1 [Solanum stenotomum]|uniref:uncharacterized protein LOC125874604 isoform X1 n=1 Tax=Solanum stenotomum TaxID=172797 RepID=UPI0020D0F744|nr:uncharacterized protein LOC125874604 isoform X1 [Solanum stenotomum]